MCEWIHGEVIICAAIFAWFLFELEGGGGGGQKKKKKKKPLSLRLTHTFFLLLINGF
jgi:hypothetical protein